MSSVHWWLQGLRKSRFSSFYLAEIVFIYFLLEGFNVIFVPSCTVLNSKAYGFHEFIYFPLFVSDSSIACFLWK